MNLNNFDEYIDDVILKRGKDYFENGNVDKIEEITRNHYIAEVAGSEDYCVDIILDDTGNIIGSTCDCPYDWGEYCKHQAAAFFALKNEKTSSSEKPKKQLEKENEPDLPTLLSKFTKEKLISIIIDFSQEYPEIEKMLLFKYASGKNEIAASKTLIKEYIRKAKDRGFIQWNRVSDALIGTSITLEKARDKVEMGDAECAVSLCILVLSSVVEMLGYCDDSGGEVSIVMNETFDIINDAILRNEDLLEEKQQVKLYNAIMKEALHKRYEEWPDWRLNLFQACIYLASNSVIRGKLEKELESMIERSEKDNSWSRGYFNEQVKLLQLELLERFEGKERALQFIQENIQFCSFREKAIIDVLEKEQYQEAVRLCLEGEEANKDYPGLVHKWKKYRLEAYEGLGDKDSQREMLLDFVLRDHSEYYSQLKNLYTTEEWSAVLEEILQTFESRSYMPTAYVEILKQENLTDKLLDYCKRRPYLIENLYPYLIQDYDDEVDSIFIEHIETESQKASDRKKYKKVCSVIKIYEKVCGRSNGLLIINGLKEKFIRKPAFLDELNKLERKWM